MTPVRVGLLGCGNVGAALVSQVQHGADAIESRTGLRLEIARVAVRNLYRERPVHLPEGCLTHDAGAVVADPDVDVVVEAIGGVEPARTLVLDALKSGKPVVTANKELLANVGSELFAAADAARVDLLFEAAVGGGIPLIRPLRESLAGERIRRVMGIVNGTTN
jgi:homoserine dehydrogenase